jgi:hypothetical protein
MDVFDLDEVLIYDRDDRVAIESLIISAVKQNLFKLNEKIHSEYCNLIDEHSLWNEEHRSRWDEQTREEYEDCVRAFNRALDEREDILRILLALCANVDGEPTIDSAALEAVLKARERQSTPNAPPRAARAPAVRAPKIGGRGRRADVRPVVIAGIRRGLEQGKYTIDQLKDGTVSHESLAEEFNCSRSPIRAALAEILGNGDDRT